ncbi:MAG TPA: Mov34/MPN/PAD-1 family protein [Gemmataceae bacterium]|nr:Mov34/MPN/PAD-1 family protein [Gemmataceae bacterium]
MSNTMTRPQTYRFHLEFRSLQDAQVRGDISLTEIDFAHAVEAALFDGLRRSRFTRYEVPRAGVRLEPRFYKAKSGLSLCVGFAVILPTPDGGEHRVDCGLQWFRSRAERVIADMVLDTAVLPSVVLFQLAAYPDDGVQPYRRHDGIVLEANPLAVPIQPGSRRELGPAVAWDGLCSEDLPVFIPRRVLEDALTEARSTPDHEVGGVLLGHLRRDTGDDELFLEVTCHVPAQATETAATSITFTADTWDHARRVADLRGEGEIFVGWVHSHPFLLPDPVPEPLPVECVNDILFFSDDDRFVMEQAFARPFLVALQTAVDSRLERALGHLPLRLYGWRDGEVVPRGFQVIEGR